MVFISPNPQGKCKVKVGGDKATPLLNILSKNKITIKTGQTLEIDIFCRGGPLWQPKNLLYDYRDPSHVRLDNRAEKIYI